VRFIHPSGMVSATWDRLLERRGWTTPVAEGATVRPGEIIEFAWSTDSDGMDQVDASFIMGATKQLVSPQLTGITARVPVPSLPPGPWTLAIAGAAHAAVADCNGVTSCSSLIVRENDLSLSIP
jgi:hypothetical protein